MCQALHVLPRNLMSSDGILGCGWLRLMPSSRACTTLGLFAACCTLNSRESREIIGFASCSCCSFCKVAHTMGKSSTHRW